MEISGIESTFPFLFKNGEKAANDGLAKTGDIVDVRQPALLSDEEAETVFNDTINLIGQDGAAALSVHSGLSQSRVFALLGI